MQSLELGRFGRYANQILLVIVITLEAKLTVVSVQGRRLHSSRLQKFPRFSSSDLVLRVTICSSLLFPSWLEFFSYLVDPFLPVIQCRDVQLHSPQQINDRELGLREDRLARRSV